MAVTSLRTHLIVSRAIIFAPIAEQGQTVKTVYIPDGECKMLGMFTKILMQSNGTFRKAVDTIISFAKDTYRSIFSREEAKTIKSVMEGFGKDKEDYRVIGTFLVFTADKKETLSNSEYRKAAREVDDIAIGRYEQAQKRGNSMKL
mgnify:CR=1 FL=1